MDGLLVGRRGAPLVPTLWPVLNVHSLKHLGAEIDCPRQAEHTFHHSEMAGLFDAEIMYLHSASIGLLSGTCMSATEQSGTGGA
jgi:hypothetical protein